MGRKSKVPHKTPPPGFLPRLKIQRRLMWGAAVGVAVALALALVAWLPAPVPNLNDPRRIEQGAAIYARHCASCHGANLEGQPNWRTRMVNGRLPAPPHDDSGHTWHHRNEMLFVITRDGLAPPYAPPGYESDMPAFGTTLSDDQIWDAIAFIRSRWSESVRSKHNQLGRR